MVCRRVSDVNHLEASHECLLISDQIYIPVLRQNKLHKRKRRRNGGRDLERKEIEIRRKR